MVALLDNLLALIIGVGVMLILMTMSQRQVEMNIRSASNAAAKTLAADLATWMEDDLMLIGDGMNDTWSPGDPPSTYTVPFENPRDSAGVTVEFQFSRDSTGTSAGVQRYDIRYLLRHVGKVQVGEELMSVYQMDREERLGGGSWANAGGSLPLIGGFSVELLDRDGNAVANPKGVMQAAPMDPAGPRNLRVRFDLITPYQTRVAAVRRLYYGSTLMVDV